MNPQKILVMSDSHGTVKYALQAIEKEKPFDLLVHLGDVQGHDQEIVAAAGCSCYFVRGNCDYDMQLPTFTVFQIGNHKVYAAHGHRNHVEYGTENLEFSALQNGCDIAMYGHTHVPDLREKERITVLNPGSITSPRQNNPQRSYVVMTPDPDTGGINYELKFL